MRHLLDHLLYPGQDVALGAGVQGAYERHNIVGAGVGLCQGRVALEAIPYGNVLSALDRLAVATAAGALRAVTDDARGGAPAGLAEVAPVRGAAALAEGRVTPAALVSTDGLRLSVQGECRGALATSRHLQQQTDVLLRLTADNNNFSINEFFKFYIF